ncbi:MAG: beta galactosidase jelly roll domain-containing protein [Acidobacteria bacterium]|nr:beta galactosidase jelly roll domain-containing protein [Acidobacteriota bacterium]
MNWLRGLAVSAALMEIGGSVFAAAPQAVAAAAATRAHIDLGGRWRFAIDPARGGEQYGWHKPGLNLRDWGEVAVPHCWNLDPRYPHTGAAWYRRTFALPAGAAGKHVRLAFESVFYRARVWINGHFAGEHEGGYTPFSIDATPHLQPGDNTLAVEVDNSWNTTTLPGARIGPRAQDQVYPWMEYGGILRPVRLLVTDPVHIARLRVTAKPDLAAGAASVDITAYVANETSEPVNAALNLQLQDGAAVTAEAPLPARSITPLRARIELKRNQVRLWDVDHPHLYTLRASLARAGSTSSGDEDSAVFGIRTIEARGGRLLLNGEPVRMAGGNRHADHPRTGSMDHAETVDSDMRQMKLANLEFARLSHYPLAESVLDWADRNGVLILEEGLNWQLTGEQMDSELLRGKFQTQMREMIERDWNHPSVIGWSVGNEYVSYQPAGLRWTKDMIEWVKTIDDSRLVTFVSNHAFSTAFQQPDQEASRYVDLICINMYEDLAARLDRVHLRWPDKPVLVSEYGVRGDALSPAERDAFFREAYEIFRARPYVVGASVWTYNDYRSRWPVGTDKQGRRQWGVVTYDRQPKSSYAVLAAESSPALIRDAGAVNRGASTAITAAIASRADFPAYTLRGYTAHVRLLDAVGSVLAAHSVALPALEPGAVHTVQALVPVSAPSARARVEVVRPTGFLATSVEVAVHE